MNPFQISATIFIALLILVGVIFIARRNITLKMGVLWIAFWVAALVVITNPVLVKSVSNFMGIGRGADLVIYTAFIVGSVIAFYLYMRIRRMEKQLTEIVRHLAILSAQGSIGDPAAEKIREAPEKQNPTS